MLVSTSQKLRLSLRRWGGWALFALCLGLLALTLRSSGLDAVGWVAVRLPDFAAIFLGIFIEAAPFLLLGTLASGLVEVFLDQGSLARLMPRQAGWGALAGGLLGLTFPVCECGVVPLTRRLLRKGMPLSSGIAFLLAAPVLNPIVILSTAAAFGFGNLLLLRVGLSLVISVSIGLIFSVEKAPWKILRPTPWVMGEEALAGQASQEKPSLGDRWRRVLLIALDEFFEMGRYLVAGAALAAGMQVFLPQSALLAVSQEPLTSLFVMAGLAVLLSICSTVDAFVALGFVGLFSPGSILVFLIFGPMVDIKSVLMYGRVFHLKVVVYLVSLALLMSLLAGLLVNYFFPGAL